MSTGFASNDEVLDNKKNSLADGLVDWLDLVLLDLLERWGFRIAHVLRSNVFLAKPEHLGFELLSFNARPLIPSLVALFDADVGIKLSHGIHGSENKAS